MIIGILIIVKCILLRLRSEAMKILSIVIFNVFLCLLYVALGISLESVTQSPPAFAFFGFSFGAVSTMIHSLINEVGK